MVSFQILFLSGHLGIVSGNDQPSFNCMNPDAARLGCCNMELSIQQETCNTLLCLGFTLKLLFVFSADGVFHGVFVPREAQSFCFSVCSG